MVQSTEDKNINKDAASALTQKSQESLESEELDNLEKTIADLINRYNKVIENNDSLISLNAHMKRNNNRLVEKNNDCIIKSNHDEEACNLVIDKLQDDITLENKNKNKILTDIDIRQAHTLGDTQPETAEIDSLNDIENIAPISTKFKKLYDCEWTHLYMEALSENHNIGKNMSIVLLKILSEADQLVGAFIECLQSKGVSGSKLTEQFLVNMKQLRTNTKYEVAKKLPRTWSNVTLNNITSFNKYTDACLSTLYYSRIMQPSLYLHIPRKTLEHMSSHTTEENAMDYVIWPAIMIDSTAKDPIVIKGIYQPKLKLKSVADLNMIRRSSINSKIGKEHLNPEIETLTAMINQEEKKYEQLQKDRTALKQVQQESTDMYKKIDINEDHINEDHINEDKDTDPSSILDKGPDSDKCLENKDSSYQQYQNMVSDLQQLKESNRLLRDMVISGV